MKIRHAALFTAALVALSGCSSDDADVAATDTTATQGAAAESEDVPAQAPDTSSDEALPAEVVEMLAGYGVTEGDGVRDAIMTLDRSDEQRPLSVQASVRTAEVVFSDDSGQEISVPIPGDLVYVSIAPFVETTHPCHFHALGGCQGKLVGEDVHVRIVDHLGEVLVDEEATTWTNGFVGYWLPKDAHGTVTITQGERSGVAAFETGDGDATCMTTLQLSA